MAEGLAKYKQILDREDREFHEAMSVEVSTSLSSESSKKVELQQDTCYCPFYIEFVNFLPSDA